MILFKNLPSACQIVPALMTLVRASRYPGLIQGQSWLLIEPMIQELLDRLLLLGLQSLHVANDDLFSCLSVAGPYNFANFLAPFSGFLPFLMHCHYGKHLT